MLPIRVGWGGWVRFVDSDGDATLVRATRAPESDRLYVSELYLERPLGFTSGELGLIDLRAIEWRLNSDSLRREVLESLNFPGIDLATASDYFGTTFGAGQRNWVADMLRSQIRGSDVPAVPRKQFSFDEPTVRRVDLMEEARVEDPGGRPRPDSFYLEVLEVQQELMWLAPRRSAAEIIARANGVPKTTVERWLRRARDIEQEVSR